MSDLVMRLGVIEDRAKTIQRKHSKSRVPSDDDGDVAVLAYCVIYLTTILKKHLETNER